MKRQFFGYHKRKTDELIDSLQSQNDLLSEKLADMTIKINALTQEVAAKNATQEDNEEHLQMHERIASLEKIIEEQKKENEALKADHQTLLCEVHLAGNPKENSEIQPLSDKQLKDIKELLQNMNTFMSKVELSRSEVQVIMDDFQKEYYAALRQITEVMTGVYKNLQSLEISSEKLDVLCNIDSIADQIKSSIDTLLTSMNQTDAKRSNLQ